MKNTGVLLVWMMMVVASASTQAQGKAANDPRCEKAEKAAEACHATRQYFADLTSSGAAFSDRPAGFDEKWLTPSELKSLDARFASLLPGVVALLPSADRTQCNAVKANASATRQCVATRHYFAGVMAAKTLDAMPDEPADYAAKFISADESRQIDEYSTKLLNDYALKVVEKSLEGLTPEERERQLETMQKALGD